MDQLETMLIYHRTNLLQSPAQTLVNTVNCVGVMGKGVAAEFKARFPQMFDLYRRICDEGMLEPGKLWLWKGPDQWVLNFPTKKHWRNPSKLEWIEAGLSKFVAEYQNRGIREAAFPRLGCGNGNLDWNDVRPLMERYLSRLPINIYIHDFEKDIGIPEHLESLARRDSSRAFDGSYSSFKKQVDAIIHRCGSQLIDFETRKPFAARHEAGGWVIKSDDAASLFPEEDLEGAWRGLLTGLLTKDKLAWGEGEDTTRALSIFSLMPFARPIEIQKASEPKSELAVQWLRHPAGTRASDVAA